MNITDLKRRSAQILSTDGGNLRRLTLIHTGITLGISAVVTVISFLLSRQIETTGGLSGIGTRTVLSFAQTLLTVLVSLLLPFWDIGYQRAALLTVRGMHPTGYDLPEGFRRFMPVMRLFLLRLALITAVCFACLQAASILFMMSPWSLRTLETMDQLLLEMDPAQLQTMDLETAMKMLPTLIPVYVLWAVLMIPALFFVVYRLRLANFAIMDTAIGARAAFRESGKRLRGKLFAFLKLDLSFWWYLALQLAVSAVAYGDLLAQWLHLALNQDAAYFIFYFASLVLQLLVAWLFAPRVQTAYAVAYEALTPTPANQELTMDNDP